MRQKCNHLVVNFVENSWMHECFGLEIRFELVMVCFFLFNNGANDANLHVYLYAYHCVFALITDEQHSIKNKQIEPISTDRCVSVAVNKLQTHRKNERLNWRMITLQLSKNYTFTCITHMKRSNLFIQVKCSVCFFTHVP